MMTPRSILRYAFRCGNYEGEDVLCDVDDVDLLSLRAGSFSLARREIQKKIVWHDFTRKAVLVNMAFQPTTLSRDYDLFVAYLPLTQDLIHIPAIRGWKDRCRTSVCWIDEIWAADVAKLRPWLSALDSFDHVVIGYRGTVEPLSEALGRPCHFLPIGVDTQRFSPFPRQVARAIDILSIGRRTAEVHHACLELARETGMFYVYDTLNASYAEVNDHRAHREMLASMAKRSRFFVVAPAKAGAAEGSRGQVEVGLRYYEAAAAGAVMVGQAPSGESFRELFDWPDAVVELKADGSDVAEVLRSLDSDPTRVSEISHRNAAQALLRHDWAYRWERILEIAGLEPAPRLLERKAHLLKLAQMCTGQGIPEPMLQQGGDHMGRPDRAPDLAATDAPSSPSKAISS